MQYRATTFILKKNVIVGRIVGEPTEDQLRACHQRLMSLVRDTGSARVLYDVRRLRVPPVDIVLAQRSLNQELNDLQLRRAIVVSSTRAGYLAGLTFGQGNYRVFYGDTKAAMSWLNDEDGRVSASCQTESLGQEMPGSDSA